MPTLAAVANLPGFDLSARVGLLAPAGLPADITTRLSDQINRTLQRKDIADRLVALGADVAPAHAAELDRCMRSQLTSWDRKVKVAGITPE